MSPKKKVKAAPAEEQTGPIIQAADQCEVDTVNMDHYNALEKAIQTILQHELFENIMNEAPLGIKAGVESHLAGDKAGPREGFQIFFWFQSACSILPVYSLKFAPVLGLNCCKAWGYDPHPLQQSRALGTVVRSVFS